MKSVNDSPKSLKEEQVRDDKFSKLETIQNIALKHFVENIRKETGMGNMIPYFDPDDGGLNARCLFLLEAPGPKAVESGFVSRNNPDETAKNFFELNNEAGIPRKETISWNIVPWYIGTGNKIRPAKSQDITEGMKYLEKLLILLHKLELVVLIGRKAQKAKIYFEDQFPKIEIMSMFHPSPLYINRMPGNRKRVLGSLHKVARFLETA